MWRESGGQAMTGGVGMRAWSRRMAKMYASMSGTGGAQLSSINIKNFRTWRNIANNIISNG